MTETTEPNTTMTMTMTMTMTKTMTAAAAVAARTAIILARAKRKKKEEEGTEHTRHSRLEGSSPAAAILGERSSPTSDRFRRILRDTCVIDAYGNA